MLQLSYETTNLTLTIIMKQKEINLITTLSVTRLVQKVQTMNGNNLMTFTM